MEEKKYEMIDWVELAQINTLHRNFNFYSEEECLIYYTIRKVIHNFYSLVRAYYGVEGNE